ncbi:MAG: PAS domain S-box protein, partial [Bacteroidetes bacterium]|nr:PAS domain S-box protein [Bacteroidota bacterium]
EGIICPGFINTHCHLELSYLKNKIQPGCNLESFIKKLERLKKDHIDKIPESIIKAEDEMIANGIVAVGDISNGNSTFAQKSLNEYKYVIVPVKYDFQKSENKYRTLFEQSADAILIIENNKFVDCNDSTVKMLRYKNKKELLNIHPSVLSPEFQPDGRESFEKAEEMMNIAFQKGSHRFEWDHKKADGEVFPVEVLLTVVSKDDKNKILHTVWRDITKRKKAENELRESQQRLSNHLDNTPLGAIFWNVDFKVTGWNRAAEKIYGYSKEEALGKQANELIVPKEIQDKVDDVFNHLLTQTGGERSTNENITKEGKCIICDWYNIATTDTNGKVTGVASLVDDITDKKKMTEELIIAKEKAEESNRIISNFYANMSHELRTPLVGILGFSEIIKEESDNEEFKQFGSMIYSSAFRLQRTLNTILDFSKIEKSKFKLDIEEINVNTFIQNEFSLFKIEAENKQLDYRVSFSSDSISINSDKRLLGTIINHLIDNAVKYTDKGFVEVNVSTAKEDDTEHLIIEIKDSGKGIKEEQLNLIWEEFRQVSEGLARLYEGVGLGLSIVKKFVGLLNGSVDVKSKFGKGSSFCVKIPMFFSPSENVTTKITVTDNKKDRTADKDKFILIVEDEIINAIAATKFLDKVYSIEVASTPKDAFEMCELNNYSLVLMDINLKSDMDGIELMKELKRKYLTYKDIPFVAITAYAMITDKRRIMDSGFNDYISKPYARNELLEIVEKNLHIRN